MRDKRGEEEAWSACHSLAARFARPKMPQKRAAAAESSVDQV